MSEPVKVFMKETCLYSLALVRKLEHDGVEYVKYDVEQDAARLDEMLALNGGRCQRSSGPKRAWRLGSTVREKYEHAGRWPADDDVEWRIL